MASEEHEEVSVSIGLPRDLREWLDEQAAAQDVDRATVLERILATHQAVATGDEDAPDVVDESELEDALDGQREEFADLLDDVRKRVVQVKREADAKAPREAHDELAGDVEDLSGRLDDVAEDVDDLGAAVAAVEAELDEGFENFEDVLEYLTDRSEVLGDRLDRLARAVVDARSELRRLGADAATRTETERLKLAANQHGIHAAKCEDCDGTVDVGLLTEAACPHCATAFDGVDPKDGFFGSNILTTGEPPALEGTQETKLDASLDDLVETGGDDQADGEDERGEP